MEKIKAFVKMGGSDASAAISGLPSEENESIFPSLSLKNRIVGCFGCMAVGFFFSILSWVSVFTGDISMFAVFFTLGNIVAVCGSLFLVGPVRQVRGMFKEYRWIATIVYLTSMLFTILSAVLLHNGALVIVSCIIQFAAMWWYFLSYIPFARDLVRNTAANIVTV